MICLFKSNNKEWKPDSQTIDDYSDVEKDNSTLFVLNFRLFSLNIKCRQDIDNGMSQKLFYTSLLFPSIIA